MLSASTGMHKNCPQALSKFGNTPHKQSNQNNLHFGDFNARLFLETMLTIQTWYLGTQWKAV